MKASYLKMYTLLLIVPQLSIGCKVREDAQVAAVNAEECKSQDPGAPPPAAPKVIHSVPYKEWLSTDDRNKEAAIIYYTVDTKELYFQGAVAQEIKQLKRVCDGSPTARKINWIVLANSHYTSGSPSAFLVCKQGKLLAPVPYSKYPQLTKKIERVRQLIQAGSSSAAYQSELDFPTKFPSTSEIKKSYAEAPFAHPEVFKLLMEFAQQEFFSPKTYLPFLHLKSHGSSRLFLTGLTDTQTDNKTKCQNALLDKALREKNPSLTVDQLNQKALKIKNSVAIQYGKIGMTNEPAVDELISLVRLGKVGLGKLPAGLNQAEPGLNTEADPLLGIEGDPLLNIEGDPILSIEGDPTLGFFSEATLGGGVMASLGSAGLGTVGLGTVNHFGSDQTQFLAVIRWLNQNKNFGSLGFVFAESCESKVSDKKLVEQAFQTPMLGGYYSASGSLWFRNLDWDFILRVWSLKGGNSQDLQNYIVAISQRVPNYVFE